MRELFKDDTLDNPISTYIRNRHEIDNLNIMPNVNSIASYTKSMCWIMIQMQ